MEEKELYKNYQITLRVDEDAISPREWDNLGTMYYRHRDYKLGDEAIPSSYYSDKYESMVDIDNAKDFSEWISETSGEEIALMLPLAIYDHSGLTMWVGSRWDGIDAKWDCSDVGWIVVTKEQLKKEYNVKRISKKLLDKAEQVLRSEVKTFDSYLTGEVYSYLVEDDNGDFVDSCSGFYAYDEALEEAKRAVDYHQRQVLEKKLTRLKQLIIGKVNISYR